MLGPAVETSRVAPCPALVVADELERIPGLLSAYGAALVLVLLTSRSDAARALDAGADGVVAKNAPAELRARVRALLRRRSGGWPAAVAVGPLQIDLRGRCVAVGGARLALRAREFALLACLASEPGRVFTKRELILCCWAGNDPPARSRALEAQIVRLRRQLGRHAPMLVTVWGVGYVLTAPR